MSGIEEEANKFQFVYNPLYAVKGSRTIYPRAFVIDYKLNYINNFNSLWEVRFNCAAFLLCSKLISLRICLAFFLLNRLQKAVNMLK